MHGRAYSIDGAAETFGSSTQRMCVSTTGYCCIKWFLVDRARETTTSVLDQQGGPKKYRSQLSNDKKIVLNRIKACQMTV